MERRVVRITLTVALVIVAAVGVLYITFVNSQPVSQQPYIPRFVGSYIALMAALIGVSLLSRPEVAAIRVPLRAAAAGGLFVLGFVSASAIAIGPPLVLAAFFVLLALSRTERTPRTRAAQLSGLVAAAVAVAVLLTGLVVTEHLVVCPDTGKSAGGGSGLLTGPYQWECNDGRLTYH